LRTPLPTASRRRRRRPSRIAGPRGRRASCGRRDCVMQQCGNVVRGIGGRMCVHTRPSEYDGLTLSDPRNRPKRASEFVTLADAVNSIQSAETAEQRRRHRSRPRTRRRWRPGTPLLGTTRPVRCVNVAHVSTGCRAYANPTKSKTATNGR
jgi:hypothetical protein